ncbi:unnamed protein product [Protopolystoma xenopodis]|uniref:Uncharacterized protein n=1 Tax=Protopolystoma xenopodis TaxID=117903 RepID=A0A3S5FBV3_9PLAT|nr:unnamed protein product [Protopolystoma xenopodis]
MTRGFGKDTPSSTPLMTDSTACLGSNDQPGGPVPLYVSAYLSRFPSSVIHKLRYRLLVESLLHLIHSRLVRQDALSTEGRPSVGVFWPHFTPAEA